MAFIRKELSMGDDHGKSKKKQEEAAAEVASDAHSVAGCPRCAALTRRNAELEGELASLRKVIQRTLSRASGEHNDSHNDKMRPGGARHP